MLHISPTSIFFYKFPSISAKFINPPIFVKFTFFGLMMHLREFPPKFPLLNLLGPRWYWMPLLLTVVPRAASSSVACEPLFYFKKNHMLCLILCKRLTGE